MLLLVSAGNFFVAFYGVGRRWFEFFFIDWFLVLREMKRLQVL